MARVIALTTIEHDQRVYAAGEPIELDDAAALVLILAGAADIDTGENSSGSPASGGRDTAANTDGASAAPPEAPAEGDEPAADAAAEPVAEPAAPARRKR